MSTSLLMRPGRVLVGGVLQPGLDVLIQDGVVAAIGPGLDPGDARVIDLADCVLAPGFVDLHVHALDGAGLVGPGAPDINGLSRALARRGVTGFLATTVTAPIAELVAVLAQDLSTLSGARCLGFHLEGPWLAPAKAGAQPAGQLALPDLADVDALVAAGPPIMITLAPELAGAVEVIERAAAAGVVVSLGHTGATFAEATAGFAAGARHVTHCFNAMAPLHHREPGLIGAALDRDLITVEVIADGAHLHPAVVRLLWRQLGAQRLCLVSDAVDIDLPGDTSARLADGTLAGSRIGLDQAVRNLVGWGIPLEAALTMASSTPADAIDRSHRIELSAPADLVLLDADLQVVMTLVGGLPVWERR